MAHKKIASDTLPPDVEVFQHTIKNPRAIEERVRRAMKLAGYKDFTAFALTAQVTRCRQIEQEHGVDANGKPVR